MCFVSFLFCLDFNFDFDFDSNVILSKLIFSHSFCNENLVIAIEIDSSSVFEHFRCPKTNTGDEQQKGEKRVVASICCLIVARLCC